MNNDELRDLKKHIDTHKQLQSTQKKLDVAERSLTIALDSVGSGQIEQVRKAIKQIEEMKG